ncbi:MAG: 3-dehydroquinate synthase, partial [Geobacteraceae bacterium]
MILDTVSVGLGDRSYKIHLGHNVLAEIGPLCRALQAGNNVAVVTNPVVAAYFFESVKMALS